MISKQQFVRLTLVLAIPLILAGVWVSDQQKTALSIECSADLRSNIVCISQTVENLREYDYLHKSNTIYLGGSVFNTVLLTGFDHPIVTLVKSAQGGAEEITENSVKRMLRLPLRNMNCELTPSLGENFYYSCRLNPELGSFSIQTDGGFQFANAETGLKFREAFASIRAMRADHHKTALWLSLFWTLTPLLAYFLFFAVALLLIKIGKYVIYGRRKTVV